MLPRYEHALDLRAHASNLGCPNPRSCAVSRQVGEGPAAACPNAETAAIPKEARVPSPEAAIATWGTLEPTVRSVGCQFVRYNLFVCFFFLFFSFSFVSFAVSCISGM